MSDREPEALAVAYCEIVRVLAPIEVDAIWSAVLFHRSKNLPAHLRPAAQALSDLYDRIGKRSARRALERSA